MTGTDGAGRQPTGSVDGGEGARGLEALVKVLAGVLTMVSDRFVFNAHTRSRPEGVYVQGLLEDDGALHLEVPSNAFLDPPLNSGEIERVLGLGWQPPGDEVPNYWQVVPASDIVPGPLAAQLVRTLVDVYGVAAGDEFTLSPADLAAEAVADTDVEQIPQPDAPPADDHAADVVRTLLLLLGAREVGQRSDGARLFRLDRLEEAVAVAADRPLPRLQVEVPDLDPAGLNRLWRLRGLQFQVRALPKSHDTGFSLWVESPVSAQTVSLNQLRALLADLAEASRRLHHHVERVGEAELVQAQLWEGIDALDPDLARLLHLLGNSDEPTDDAPNAGLLAQIGDEYVIGGNWPLAEQLSSPPTATRWLLHRSAPDCGHLFVGDGQVVVSGAIGWVALAVEATPSSHPEHDTLLGLLARELPPARKAVTLVRPLMPPGPFGWLRPLLLEGSTRTGGGRVLCYDPACEEMLEDPQMSMAWRAILADPGDRDAVQDLKAGISTLVDRLLSPSGASPTARADAPAATTETDPHTVRRPVPVGCRVIEGSTPVVAFGDPTVARIATLGINPSRAEFLHNAVLLRGERRRLAALESLGATATHTLTNDQIAQVEQECAEYFHRNPYRRWFDPFDQMLSSAFGVSYYTDTACHLDIVQSATDPIWSVIPDRQAQQRLLDEGAPHLRRQLETDIVNLVIVNGDRVWRQLTATGLAVWQRVASMPYGNGRTQTELRMGRGCGVTFLGWSLNIQSTFGVRATDRVHLADWLRETVATSDA